MAQDQVRVLYADDEQLARRMVGYLLQNEGMQVLSAENGLQAIDIWRQNPVDILLLDVRMPLMNGLEVCRLVRQTSDVPVIMLSAREEESEVVEGLAAGADDYIIKPYRSKELVARLHAVLSRVNRHRSQESVVLVFQGLRLDTNAQRVTLNEENIQVTPLELRLLKYLMQRPGEVISKKDLLTSVWGYMEPDGPMNLVEASIRRLREKIEADPSNPHYIQTVRGLGYRLGD